MPNIEKYIPYLWLDIAATAIFGVIILIFVNILLYIVKRFAHEKIKKITWIGTNVIVWVAVFAFLSLPTLLDITQSSIYAIDNVVKVETDVTIGKNHDCVYVYTENGEKYEFYRSLLTEKEENNINYPGTIIYAKHSQAVIEYIPYD